MNRLEKQAKEATRATGFHVTADMLAQENLAKAAKNAAIPTIEAGNVTVKAEHTPTPWRASIGRQV